MKSQLSTLKSWFEMVDSTEELTRLRLSEPTCVGLEERQDASLVLPSSAEPLNATPKQLSPMHIVEGKLDLEKAVIGTDRIPVVSRNGTPLMPCKSAKARKLLRDGKARKQYDKLGIFYLQLHFNPTVPTAQPLVLGIDAGSKFEAFSIVGAKDTVLNIMSKATIWVKKAVEQRRTMRRSRRQRKTRRRECRFNNRLTSRKHVPPPSTKARWDTKLRIVRELEKILSMQTVVIEDIKAVARKNEKRWNSNFSPLEVGKQYFYAQVNRKLVIKSGKETKALRETYGLKKLKNKSKPVFETHCVDAWVLAASVSGAEQPSTYSVHYLTPLHWNRRQLHMLQPSKMGTRRRQGGTMSLGLKKGSLVKHETYGFCYVGGNMNGKFSLHSMDDAKRLTQDAKRNSFKVLTRIAFRTRFLPRLKPVGMLGGSR